MPTIRISLPGLVANRKRAVPNPFFLPVGRAYAVLGVDRFSPLCFRQRQSARLFQIVGVDRIQP